MEETAKRRGALLKIIPIFGGSISHNCVKVSTTTTTFGTPKLFIKQYFILFCGSFPFLFSLALLLLMLLLLLLLHLLRLLLLMLMMLLLLLPMVLLLMLLLLLAAADVAAVAAAADVAAVAAEAALQYVCLFFLIVWSERGGRGSWWDHQ